MTANQKNRQQRKPDLSRYFPAGYNRRQEISWNIAGLICSFLYCAVVFMSRLNDAKYLLYDVTMSGEKILIAGRFMKDFHILFKGCLLGYFILMAGCVLWAMAHYRYHYQGSKSIYLMRRLPDGRDLWRRCLAAPTAVLILSAAAAFTTLLFFFGIYHLITPETALTPGQWHMIWN